MTQSSDWKSKYSLFEGQILHQSFYYVPTITCTFLFLGMQNLDLIGF